MAKVKNSHYVPRVYLKSWSKDNRIYTYDLFVPHKNSPLWKGNSTRFTSSEKYFYAYYDNNDLNDGFEDIFSKEIEGRYPEFLNKINAYEKLEDDDFKFISKFVLSQYYRTMKGYKRLNDIVENSAPNIIQNLSDKLNSLDLKNEEELQQINNKIEASKPDDSLIPLNLELLPNDNHTSLLKFETMIGKNTWLEGLNYIINRLYKRFDSKDWQIASAPKNSLLLTSDDPVILIRRDKDGYGYFTNGGFNSENSRVYFPLTPTKILLSKDRNEDSQTQYILLSKEDVDEINRLTVLNADLKVYGIEKDDKVIDYRPRIENEELFKEIKNMREQFHSNYENIEIPFIKMSHENTLKFQNAKDI